MNMERKYQREKLINLIVNAKRADPETGSFTEFLADFLLGYGVFVPDDEYDLDRLRELIYIDRERKRWLEAAANEFEKPAIRFALEADGWYLRKLLEENHITMERLVELAQSDKPSSVGRCGECKRWGNIDEYRDGDCKNPDGINNVTNENDFCSRFEPKGDEEND